ncbi:MAG: transposase [Pseudotabrizicola sp.]|uniref:IS66 family transposase n=1 Tax=Pseudotabrizicola sp. TaxID=2939647 RepID=UPI0027321E00|nr:transposase [Pseudotabrizicola sp.]MDP2081510.1 transposase [Pseudotabrizicola sp.]MDZ7575713.1 transposase [Pseudotabrizicola sp.]
MRDDRGQLSRHVLSADAIFADDTPLNMLASGTGKTQIARFWTYARDERPWGGTAPPAHRYRFSGDRKGGGSLLGEKVASILGENQHAKTPNQSRAAVKPFTT